MQLMHANVIVLKVFVFICLSPLTSVFLIEKVKLMFDFLRRKKEVALDESAFHIEDRGYEKVLKYGSITYSKVKGEGIYTGEYWDYFIPAAYVFPSPRILIIGFGGGTIAFQLSVLLRESATIDAIEMSSRAVELSKGMIPHSSANLIVGDGAEYVRTSNNKYDLAILDAYVSSRIPEQFLRSEFVDNAYKTLSRDGIMTINYAMKFMGTFKFWSYVKILKKRFHVYKINTALFEGNLILICSKSLEKEGMLERIGQRVVENEDNSALLRSYREMKLL
jgi:spermidine synthase